MLLVFSTCVTGATPHTLVLAPLSFCSKSSKTVYAGFHILHASQEDNTMSVLLISSLSAVDPKHKKEQ